MFSYQAIGVLHTPHKKLASMPIQPSSAQGARGYAQIKPDFREGLKDLDGFSHLILLYHFHHSQGLRLQVVPFLDETPRGVFATRAPTRPNPLGLSIVKLDRVDGCRLYLSDVDMLDGTPLLDIKPYVPAFDHAEDAAIGWLESAREDIPTKQSDERFS